MDLLDWGLKCGLLKKKIDIYSFRLLEILIHLGSIYGVDMRTSIFHSRAIPQYRAWTTVGQGVVTQKKVGSEVPLWVLF